jgi:hypothetical protein
MKISKKIAVAAIPAVMALASTNVDSKILLMSQEGWEVSFDGAANAFIMQNSGTNVPTTSGGTAVAFDGTAGIINARNSETSIVTGLLPNVWGMTLKAPTANGLDMSARLGLYTHMNGGENALGNGQINIRETSGTISGFFGSVLVGRSLGIHQSNAILNDMLLFGVGAGASAGNSNTTLGRIGVGYLYTDFQPMVAWTLPELGNGFAAKVAILDPKDVAADTSANSATDHSAPRVEAQITWNGDFLQTGVGVNLWVDGTYQHTGRTLAETQSRQNAAGVDREHDHVESAGVGFGTKLSYEGFSLVATGFYASGLGMRGQHSVLPIMQTQDANNGTIAGSTGALDDDGKERKSYGGYIQGTFDFGQGTNIGYSYGGNYLRMTGSDMNNLGTSLANTMHSAMIWHNVTDNFRLIAEGGYAEKSWYLADDDQEDSFGGIGAFFFW